MLLRFRKQKTTYQKLEAIQEKISNIELFTQQTQEKQKRIVGTFLVLSVGVFVLCFLVFFFIFLPPTWPRRLLYSLPLLFFLFLIVWLKRLFAWYYQRKLNRNKSKLSDLREEKRKILEEVKEKETYKAALEIFDKFGEKPVGFGRGTPVLQRINNATNESTARAQQSTNNRSMTPLSRPAISPGSNLTMSNVGQMSLVRRNFLNSPTTPSLPPHLQRALAVRSPRMPCTPYPIIDPGRGVLQKMIDCLIGDGPENRFAMICKECRRHNGMILKEEYEYSSFECVYCNSFNPARKQRPTAPRLQLPSPPSPPVSETEALPSNKSSNSSSDSDSDNSKHE